MSKSSGDGAATVFTGIRALSSPSSPSSSAAAAAAAAGGGGGGGGGAALGGDSHYYPPNGGIGGYSYPPNGGGDFWARSAVPSGVAETYVFCSLVYLSCLVCDVSISLSYPSIDPCLHSLTPHGMSLTITISTQSILTSLIVTLQVPRLHAPRLAPEGGGRNGFAERGGGGRRQGSATLVS